MCTDRNVSIRSSYCAQEGWSVVYKKEWTMAIDAKKLKFVATEEKGEVSALYARPRGAKAVLVLGHGSGTNMTHRFMQELSDAFSFEVTYDNALLT